MSMHDRAAQFSAFAALSGHGKAIRETAHVTSQHMELSDDAREALEFALQQIQSEPGCKVSLTYFEPDAHKSVGEYRQVRRCVSRVDAVARLLVLDDGLEIPLDLISEIELV